MAFQVWFSLPRSEEAKSRDPTVVVGQMRPWTEPSLSKEELRMLVLNRKRSQKIFIDGTIEIRVLEIRGKTVKLGFVCPPDVAVHREEVLQRITAEEEGRRYAQSGFTATGEPPTDATVLS